MSDRSALLEAVPHIQHGFGSKLALLPGHLLPYSATLPEKKQVHGTRIVDVLQPAQACGEADGFYTRQPGILLSVLTADCLPVLFSRSDGGAIAAVHAGWRGLLDGILEQMAARIRQMATPPIGWPLSALPPARAATKSMKRWWKILNSACRYPPR